MYALYVTHPEVVQDPAVPVPQWSLSPLGRSRADRFARHPLALGLRRIVSSPETKARELAEILSKRSGAAVEIGEKFGENDRSSTGYTPRERFESLAEAFFAEPDVSAEGWETARSAQQRIVTAVGTLLSRHDATRPIGFTGHGAVGTLLKCALGGRPIARSEDQREMGDKGGGNAFLFRLSDRVLLTDWLPMEALPEVVPR
jgi:broad specificity phosphatase PhoE